MNRRAVVIGEECILRLGAVSRSFCPYRCGRLVSLASAVGPVWRMRRILIERRASGEIAHVELAMGVDEEGVSREPGATHNRRTRRNDQ